MLSAVNKGNSSLNVNSGFPHLTNTQQLQQRDIHHLMPNDSDLSCQSELDTPELEPPSVVELERLRVAVFCATATNSHSVAIGTLKKSVAHAFCASL